MPLIVRVHWPEPGQCPHQDTSSHLVDGRWLCDVCDLDTDVYREDEVEH